MAGITGDMYRDIERTLLSEAELRETVAQLGRQISADYAEKNLLLVSVLKGSVVFMADLMRAVTIPCRIDFMAVSSYGAGTKSSGAVKILKDLDMPLAGVDLLLVEDILDSGKTLRYILELLSAGKPGSVKICTLLDKPVRRQVPLQADYVGAVVPDEFVVGYGLDYNERYRNLPIIGILKSEIYKTREGLSL